MSHQRGHGQHSDAEVAAQQPVRHGRHWDDVYTGEQVWSGNPNVALVAAFEGRADETAGGVLSEMKPGRALDVGCGEGADAIYLAQRGWQVTAIDPANGAVERGRAAERAESLEPDGVSGRSGASEVTWLKAGLLDSAVGEFEPFELVSLFYPALQRESLQDVRYEEQLLRLVAPGGVLLAVGHVDMDPERVRSRGYDPELMVAVPQIAEFAEQLGWSVFTEVAEKHVMAGAGAHHHEDVVVVARRPVA